MKWKWSGSFYENINNGDYKSMCMKERESKRQTRNRSFVLLDYSTLVQKMLDPIKLVFPIPVHPRSH